MPQKHPKKQKSERETNKGWADGARDDFLSQYIDEYASSMGKGASAEDEVLRKVFRQYFYHFSLDDNIEPALPLKPFDDAWVPPADDGTLEELRARRALREKKKKAIRAWLMYRAQKITSIRSAVRRRLLSDAYLALLNKVGKLGIRPPKARSPAQEWQKQNKAEAKRIVQELWDKEVSAGRQTIPTRGGICPKFRQGTVQAHFLALSPEVRQSWADRAKTSAEEKRAIWDEIYNGPPSTAPEDRAACVANLPAFLQPVAEGIMSLTGLMTVVHVDGPMGVVNGEISVMSVCAGKNLDPIPVTVARWEPSVYEDWRNHLVKFAKTAYTQADQDAFKIPSNPQLPADFKATLFEDDVLDKVLETVNAEVAAAAEAGDFGTSDEDDSDSDNDLEKSSRKRPSSASAASTRKRQKRAGDEGSKDKGAKQTLRDPQLVMVDGQLKSKYEVEREANIRRNAAQLKALGIDLAPLPKATKKATGKTSRKQQPSTSEGISRRHSERLTTQRGPSPVSGEALPAPMDEDTPSQDDGAMVVDGAIEGLPSPLSLTSSTVVPASTAVPVATTAVIPAILEVAPAGLVVLPNCNTSAPVSPIASASVSPIASATMTPAVLLVNPIASAVTPAALGAAPRGSTPANDSRMPLKSTMAGELENSDKSEDQVIPETKVDDESRELLLEAHDWFRVPFRVFLATDWGDCWKELLEAFVKLEGSVEFRITEGFNLPRGGRPAILSDWIGDGRLKPKNNSRAARRMLTLKPGGLPAFKATFRAWWDSLQPSWRKWKDDGTLIQTRYGGDFGDLDAWGPNGWLSVVACLYWWRESETNKDELNVWEQYVNDGTWMMQGLRARGFVPK